MSFFDVYPQKPKSFLKVNDFYANEPWDPDVY